MKPYLPDLFTRPKLLDCIDFFSLGMKNSDACQVAHTLLLDSQPVLVGASTGARWVQALHFSFTISIGF